MTAARRHAEARCVMPSDRADNRSANHVEHGPGPHREAFDPYLKVCNMKNWSSPLVLSDRGPLGAVVRIARKESRDRH